MIQGGTHSVSAKRFPALRRDCMMVSTRYRVWLMLSAGLAAKSPSCSVVPAERSVVGGGRSRCGIEVAATAVRERGVVVVVACGPVEDEAGLDEGPPGVGVPLLAIATVGR
jgi:hypothetical protein